MKRPYRLGDWFAIPLGDGRYGVGIVARGTRKAIAGYVFAQPWSGLPSIEALASLDPAQASWSGAFSDRAIVEERWPVIGGSASFALSNWALEAHYERVLSPLALERLVAAGVLPTRQRIVRDLCAEVTRATLASIAPNAQIQWRAPLSPSSLEAIAGWVGIHPRASVRVYGDALAQLGALAQWPGLRTLRLGAGALMERFPRFEAVRNVALEGLPANADFARAFPHVRALRLAAGASVIDVHALSGLRKLRVLDCNGGTIETLGPLASFPNLEAVRLSRTRGWWDLAPLRATRLRALCIEQHIDLADLRPLADMNELEQLELRGLWQFNVGELGWLRSVTTLRRVTIDIGGRRKNVELYRGGGWAAAWPFAWLATDCCDEDAPVRSPG